MPYPEPPGTQGQKIEPRSGKQGPCLEGGPVLGPILGGRFWGLFPNREKPVYAEIPNRTAECGYKAFDRRAEG
jgi:hypothetical protein